MAYNSILIKRRLTGDAGSPSQLSGGELAFNEVDSTLYYGSQAGVLPIAGPGAFVSRTLAQDVSGSKTWLDTQYFSQDIDVTGTVDANTFTINTETVIDSNKDVTVRHINASGDLTVTGNLSVLGDVTSIETTTTVASAFSITNVGSGPALTVTQTGLTDVAAFYDGDEANVALVIKDGGSVGINTDAPAAKLHVDGTFLATGSLSADNGLVRTDGSGALTVNGATTLESTLDVAGATTLSADLTVVDKIQVQSSDFALSTAGSHIDIEGTSVRITDDTSSSDTTYGATGITAQAITTDYTIATNAANGKIIIDSNSGAFDIDLTASNVNITTGDLKGNTTNYIHDFIIDGGTF